MPPSNLPPLEFEGFSEPNYTQVPDAVFDRLLPYLSEAELKVLLYIIRRTFGFKKRSDAISVTQMEKGIVTRAGRVLDTGTGLSRTSIRKGSQGLVEKGILSMQRVKSDEGDYESNVFSLRFAVSGVGQNLTYPPSEFDLQVGQILTRQETVQETASQEIPVEISKFRQVHPEIEDKYDNNRLALVDYLQDYAREFRDQAPLSSSVSRSVKAYQSSGLDLETFVVRMEQARAITKEHTGNVKAGEGGKKQLMAYWFSVLEDLIGQKRQKSI